MIRPSESIWLPGAGELRWDEMAAAKAVEEYDPDLTLGQIKDTGQWAVFLRRADGSPFPVFGLGHELPGPDEIKRRLYHADVRRNGNAIVDQLERQQREEEKRLNDISSDGAGMVAEAIDSHMRAEGKHPFPRIYVPRGV